MKDTHRGLLTNPADNASPPSAKSAKAPEMVWWSPEDAQKFLTWAEDNVAEEYVVAWNVALATGMRRGELLGLRWKDIDLDNRTIAVARSVTTIKSKGEKQYLAEGPTKSGRVRVVDIDIQTAERLRWFRLYRAGSLAIKLVNPDMVVFGDEEGTWRLPESFSRSFRQQLARFRRTQPVSEQLPAIRLHSLRHTHAVWRLKAGVHPKVVQERLGHETIGITMDIYSHVMPSMGREAASQLGAMLYSK
jgi:integrase